MKGIVSSGSAEATKAGLFALEKGGNAIDAAIAAQLAAFVAEPLLTGFAGAGIASLRLDGELQLIDMFTTMPGLGRRSKKCQFDAIDIDFGPSTQRFFIGKGSIATPTMPQGLAYLHEKFARLPLETLIEPAVHIAKSGFRVSKGLETVFRLLLPIAMRSPKMLRWFSKNGRGLRAGEICHFPEMAEDLNRFAKYGGDLFLAPEYQEALRQCSDQALLSRNDIGEYKIISRKHRTKTFLGQQVHLSSEPSIGGLILDDLLDSSFNLPKEALGFEAIRSLEERLGTVFGAQASYSQRILRTLSEQFIPNSSGYTTHLSVVDSEGNAIGITSSLGESSGIVLGNSGIIFNNFLGEADVAPPMAQTQAGRRLLTMCSPTLVSSMDSKDITVYGSGGSNRIASAILQGIIYSLGYGYSVEEAVSAPRMHVTDSLVQVETFGRNPIVLAQLRKYYGNRLIEFATPNMYLGGLNVASLKDGRLVGFGDQRRSGVCGLIG